MSVYFKCEGPVTVSSDFLTAQCSGSWVQVDEPVYTLLPPGQTSQLLHVGLEYLAVFFIAGAIIHAIKSHM